MKRGKFFLSGKVPITKEEEEKKKRNPVKLIVDLEREHRPIRP
jgi:helix-turn-helix protein